MPHLLSALHLKAVNFTEESAARPLKSLAIHKSTKYCGWINPKLLLSNGISHLEARGDTTDPPLKT